MRKALLGQVLKLWPKILLIMFSAFCLTSSLALADTIQGSSGGSWTTIPTPDQTSPPFWDNPSKDSTPPGNIGQVLRASYPGVNQYWSINGNVDNKVTFYGPGYGEKEKLLFEYAGYAGSNTLYAYNVADPLQTTLIFSGNNAPGNIKSIDIPYAHYGFKLISPDGTFYSGNEGVQNPDAYSNFAFFREATTPGVFWIGIEDLLECHTGIEGLGDYQDMVLKVSTVPLSPTLLLLGSGLLGLALLGRRRKDSPPSK